MLGAIFPGLQRQKWIGSTKFRWKTRVKKNVNLNLCNPLLLTWFEHKKNVILFNNNGFCWTTIIESWNRMPHDTYILRTREQRLSDDDSRRVLLCNNTLKTTARVIYIASWHWHLWFFVKTKQQQSIYLMTKQTIQILLHNTFQNIKSRLVNETKKK